MKRYVIIAGVNGAGKSTLYQVMDSLKNMSRINTDEIVREFGDWKNSSDVIRAGIIAVSKNNHYIEIYFMWKEHYKEHKKGKNVRISYRTA